MRLPILPRRKAAKAEAKIANSIRAAVLSRRAWLALTVASIAGLAGRDVGAQPTPRRIRQLAAPTPAAFIKRAFDMKRRAVENGDQGFGAVVVRNGRILGEAPSRVVGLDDPTAHAEMEAIRDAVRRVGSKQLRGAILYSSSRPCPMCQSAAFWAGFGGMRYENPMTDGGRPTLPRC